MKYKVYTNLIIISLLTTFTSCNKKVNIKAIKNVNIVKKKVKLNFKDIHFDNEVNKSQNFYQNFYNNNTQNIYLDKVTKSIVKSEILSYFSNSLFRKNKISYTISYDSVLDNKVQGVLFEFTGKIIIKRAIEEQIISHSFPIKGYHTRDLNILPTYLSRPSKNIKNNKDFLAENLDYTQYKVGDVVILIKKEELIHFNKDASLIIAPVYENTFMSDKIKTWSSVMKEMNNVINFHDICNNKLTKNLLFKQDVEMKIERSYGKFKAIPTSHNFLFVNDEITNRSIKLFQLDSFKNVNVCKTVLDSINETLSEKVSMEQLKNIN